MVFCQAFSHVNLREKGKNMTDWQIICYFDTHGIYLGFTFEKLAIISDRSVEEVKEVLAEVYSGIL